MKGYFRKRGNKWSFTVDIGRDVKTNKRKQKTVSGFKTKKEAEQACNELIHLLNRGIHVDESKQTVSEFFDYWLEIHVVPNLRKRTADQYIRSIDNYIKKELGNFQLKNLRITTIQRFIKTLQEQGLSSYTIRTTYLILKTALTHAVKWELITKNPMENMSAPKIQKTSRGTWTFEQVNEFLNATKNRHPHYHMAFLLAVYTGMRKAEILGLQWKHVDFKNKRISIEQTQLNLTGKGYEFDGVKSHAAKRSISIDDFLIQELRKHKKRQMETKLQLGPEFTDLDLVISTHKGTPMNQRSVSKDFYIVRDQLGLPKIRFHDLRHTHATLLLQLGENVKVISERLGHSSVNITLEVYAHAMPDMQKSAADNFSSALNLNQNIK